MEIIPKILKRIFKYFLVLILLIAILFTVVNLLSEPSNNRDWNDDQNVLSYAEIEDNLIKIHNIRNFSYASTTSYIPDYYDRTYDLNSLKKVWYVVEPFSGIPGSAHTFLSFEFDDEQFLSVSVEIRKEKGESYSPWKGLFNQYELMYVIADEKDVIKLRSNYRKDIVYVYPIKTTRERAQSMFLSMIERANKLYRHPEYYNTVTNTCTTNIVKHINQITPSRVPTFNLRILLPANSDRLAYDLGLIDTDLPFDAARSRYYINEKALRNADSPDFSLKIRE